MAIALAAWVWVDGGRVQGNWRSLPDVFFLTYGNYMYWALLTLFAPLP